MRPIVDIVIPVFNRPEHTKQCIDSLFSNTDTDIFSLTVVNDCSSEETHLLLKELSNQYKFTLLHNEKNIGPGGSRNHACDYISKSGKRGHYLYFSDNDVYFKANWLPTLLQAYKEVSKRSIGLLGGSCHPYLRSNQTWELTSLPGYSVGLKDAVSGYSHLITWELWDRLGVFHTQEDMEKKTGRSDDWEYCQRMKSIGLEVASLEPEVVIPCGKTDSYGDIAVGPETFKNHEGVIVT